MKKLIWIGLASLIVLFGCELVNREFYLTGDDFPDPGKGMLVLILDSNALPAKTISPSLAMDVASYELAFTGPATPDNFITSSGSDGLYTQTGFTQGDWSVTVNAYNATPELIGTSTTTDFTIIPGEYTAVVIDVLPISGQGDLLVYLEWPDDVGVAEALTASLIKEDSTPVSNFQSGFNINTSGTNPRTAEYNTITDPGLPSIDSGYYTMILQLKDDDVLIWGWVEAVRILAGQTTDTEDKFLLTTLEGAGGVDLTSFMQIDIAFTPDPSSLTPFTQGEYFTVTAVPTPNTPPSDHTYNYQWYLDGDILVGETAAMIADFGGALDPGDYNLFVVLSEIETATSTVKTISSNGFSFTVNQTP